MGITHFFFAGLAAMACPVQVLSSEGAAGPDQSICATAAVLAADPLLPGESGMWAVVSGTGVLSNPQAPICQVTGLSPGENMLQWTIFGDGPLEMDQLLITVNDPAATVAFAGPDSVLCFPVDTMHLFATPATAPAIGSWSSVGIALIDVFTHPHSAVEFPAGGSIQMIWTVFNGTCGQVSDTALISIEDCVIGLAEPSGFSKPLLRYDPTSRVLWILNADAGTMIEVVDQTGRVVLNTTRITGREDRIDLPDLRVGAYTARIKAGDRGQVLRFVIDR